MGKFSKCDMFSRDCLERALSAGPWCCRFGRVNGKQSGDEGWLASDMWVGINKVNPRRNFMTHINKFNYIA